MDEKRARFAWPVVDPVERLRGRVPDVRLKDMPQGLLCTLQGDAIVIVQPIILHHAFKFHQFGEYGVAIHIPRVVDSTACVIRPVEPAHRRCVRRYHVWRPYRLKHPRGRASDRRVALRQMLRFDVHSVPAIDGLSRWPLFSPEL
jgi:hypothetical protein